MKENREEYLAKITKEFKDRLHLDMDKEYQISEVNDLIDTYNLKGGILQFVPTKPHTGQMIIDTLVYRDMRITDAIHKEMGIYEDKSKCEYCGGYFDAEKDRMFQVRTDNDDPFLCEKCRREHHLKIRYFDFIQRIPDEEKEKFVAEELNFGIDYSAYIERINRAKILNSEREV